MKSLTAYFHTKTLRWSMLRFLCCYDLKYDHLIQTELSFCKYKEKRSMLRQKKKERKRETFSGVCLFEVNSFFSLTSSVLLASLYLHSDATLVREAHS